MPLVDSESSYLKCCWFIATALSAILLSALPAPAMDFCSGPVRVTCVVDGDTVWINGEKIRLADIDTPEPRGECAEERAAAARAAGRLVELLTGGGYEIVRGDPVDGRLHDRFGRTLAVIRVDGTSVGDVLVEEGLARPWSGRKEAWCGAS